MVTEIEKDIFETDPKTVAIAHQANCFNTLGMRKASGIAGLIGQRYDEACEADAGTVMGDKKKLGTFTLAKCEDGRRIFNVYSQYEFGGERPTNYEMVYRGLCAVREALDTRNQIAHEKGGSVMDLAIPYGYGSMRGGGSWRIIECMICIIFENVNFDVYICRLPGQKTLL